MKYRVLSHFKTFLFSVFQILFRKVEQAIWTVKIIRYVVDSIKFILTTVTKRNYFFITNLCFYYAFSYLPMNS